MDKRSIYSQTEGEALAVMRAVEQFHQFVRGITFDTVEGRTEELHCARLRFKGPLAHCSLLTVKEVDVPDS